MNASNSFKFLSPALSTLNIHITSVLSQPYRFFVKIFVFNVFEKIIQKPNWLLSCTLRNAWVESLTKQQAKILYSKKDDILNLSKGNMTSSEIFKFPPSFCREDT